MNYEEYETSQRILKGAILCCTLILFFTIGLNFGSGAFSINKILKNSNNIACDNSTLSSAVSCLNNNFSEWFIYNETNTGKDLTIDELKLEGGVCTHATKWYKDNLDSMGFSTKEIIIYPKDNSAGHMFLVAWDYRLDSYCIVDQTTYTCSKVGSTL